MKKELIKILKNPIIKKDHGGVLTQKDVDYEKWYEAVMNLICENLSSGYLKQN